ncbi:agmatine coumaroyltransferase-2-like [Coffea arabica]|uniref:Agmatine coumaroyltransferase-2-like n=1 Tax=Coffea arabica TaxID=13443 RepID=A0A6P6SAF7_COFAR|nr:agmatine coumaroyltransferase-2-like [Coffea arabica]
MRVRLESSRIIKPLHEGIPPTTNHIPLSVFDKVTFDAHMAIIYAYHPPNPPNATLETGLRKALSVYREWAGRLSKDNDGEPIILLNDAGVRFVEASMDIELDQVMPLKPSAFCLSLHPSIQGNIQELVQVQITRFTCGSIVVGFTAHHTVADGQATSNFLVAWGQACRGLEIHPLPLHDRGIFKPRDPPCIEFEHRGVEFKNPKLEQFHPLLDEDVDGVAVDQFHFSLGFLAKLKAKASSRNGNDKSYSTFESLVAHLWKAVTKARGLSAYQTTSVRISVNGRMRMDPRIPNEYFGNLVLWALPTAKVKDLLREPVPYGAKLIHDTVANVNDNYFRSFIDFASHKVKEENLVPVVDMGQSVIECPNLDVSSWLRFPFYDLDLGGGSPYVFMPSYYPLEGTILLLPSFIGDGSIDAVIALFEDHLAAFKLICYELE